MRLQHVSSAIAVLTLLFGAHVNAQQKQTQKAPRGFSEATGITVTVAEMAGAAQKQPDGTLPKEIYMPGYPNMWIMELQYKPIRMVRVPVRDPRTGKTQRELIWYMVWRGIRRDYTQYFGDTSREELLKKLRDPELQPVNARDTQAKFKPIMTPRFTLMTEDGDQKIYRDWILPDVQSAIAKREGIQLRSTVQAIQDVPKLAENPRDQSVVEGVAIWRNVDPKTDYLKVFMTGFSNSYRIGKVEGKTVLERKTIVQRFWRPGDEFEQDEQEFRIKDKPQWTYRPEAWSVKWPTGVTRVEEVMVTRPDARPSEILKEADDAGK